MKTEGVVIYEREDFRYETINLPDPGEGEVLVEIESCGVCGADPKIFHGTAYFAHAAYRHAPIVAGHEFMGRVIALGPGAAERFRLKVGDRAVAENIVPCGTCWWCRRGQYNLCDPHCVFGIVKVNGGWARHMIYPRNAIVHKVPDSISWEDAAVVEPLACALHGINRARIQLGETVVVLGCGPIGLLMVQAARLRGPAHIIAVDRNDYRLAVARDMGADLVINPAREDPVARVKATTEEGIGCDVVLEAAGSNASVRMAVDMLRRGGRLMEFSVFAEEVSFDWSLISDIKELEIIGGHLGFHTYPVAIDLLARGLITGRRIVTHTFPLRDFRRAIDTARDRAQKSIKVLMRPG